MVLYSEKVHSIYLPQEMHFSIDDPSFKVRNIGAYIVAGFVRLPSKCNKPVSIATRVVSNKMQLGACFVPLWLHHVLPHMYSHKITIT